MIILFTEDNNYGIAKIKNIIELVDRYEDFYQIVKVFEDTDGISPLEYKDKYDSYRNLTMALVTLQPLTDIDNANSVIVESPWIREVRPVFIMTGMSAYSRVYDMNKDGVTFERYMCDNIVSITKEIEEKISELKIRLTLEKQLYNEYRITTENYIVSRRNNNIQSRLKDNEIALSLLNHTKSKIHDTEDEIEKYKKFISMLANNYIFV